MSRFILYTNPFRANDGRWRCCVCKRYVDDAGLAPEHDEENRELARACARADHERQGRKP